MRVHHPRGQGRQLGPALDHVDAGGEIDEPAQSEGDYRARVHQGRLHAAPVANVSCNTRQLSFI